MIRPEEARLSDRCGELIATFRALRDHPTAIAERLGTLNPLDKEMYYRVRGSRSGDAIGLAAEFIYLNKAGWNGLYRVNSRGEFNVPYGAPRSGNIADFENLTACATALRKPRVRVATHDFARAVSDCRAGDFVFLDPPYVTGHNNNGFIDYNKELFAWPDQQKLARVAGELADRGVHVLITNAYHDAVLDLYPGFEVHRIARSSTLAGDSSARRTVIEAAIRSYSS